ncbi:MAG: hypothetical protein DMG35_08165 [Acidobacteria bacterium]|nr:MAG: hypothetical protein DMG35_08165 [Acidobacteriota bacterium]
MEQYVFVRLHAREGQERAVEEALREVTGPSRAEPGCLSFHTFRSIRDRQRRGGRQVAGVRRRGYTRSDLGWAHSR